MSDVNFSQIIPHIQQAQSVLVMLGQKPTFDQQLSAASLFLSLSNQGKNTTLLGVEQVSNPTIVGLDQLKTEVGRQNLVVSFDYDPKSVNNVSYHIDEESNKFYLTVKPQKGESPLEEDSIETSYIGADADLIFLIGVDDLAKLDQLYIGYEDLYERAILISFNNYSSVDKAFNFDPSNSSSTSELVYQLLSKLDYEIDGEVATNLLAGIQYETNNFVDPRADANTFEAVASLLRSGARRKAGAFTKASKVGAQMTNQRKVLQKTGREVSLMESAKEKSSNPGIQKKSKNNLEKASENLDRNNKALKTNSSEIKENKKQIPLRPSGLKK